jgi:hypothetical protein
MTGTDLHGHWSTMRLSEGPMEGQNVAFLPDGSGWWEWTNAFGFEVHRFRWSVPSPGLLEVHILRYLGGTTHIKRGRRVERQRDEDEKNTANRNKR